MSKSFPLLGTVTTIISCGDASWLLVAVIHLDCWLRKYICFSYICHPSSCGVWMVSILSSPSTVYNPLPIHLSQAHIILCVCLVHDKHSYHESWHLRGLEKKKWMTQCLDDMTMTFFPAKLLARPFVVMGLHGTSISPLKVIFNPLAASVTVSPRSAWWVSIDLIPNLGFPTIWSCW